MGPLPKDCEEEKKLERGPLLKSLHPQLYHSILYLYLFFLTLDTIWNIFPGVLRNPPVGQESSAPR